MSAFNIHGITGNTPASPNNSQPATQTVGQTGTYQGAPVTSMQNILSKIDNAKEELPASFSERKHSKDIKERKKTSAAQHLHEEEEIAEELKEGFDKDIPSPEKLMKFSRHLRKHREFSEEDCLNYAKEQFDNPTHQHAALLFAEKSLVLDLDPTSPIIQATQKAKDKLIEDNAIAICQGYSSIQESTTQALQNLDTNDPVSVIGAFYDTQIAGSDTASQAHYNLIQQCGSASEYLSAVDKFIQAVGPYLEQKSSLLTSAELGSMMDSIYYTKSLRNALQAFEDVFTQVRNNYQEGPEIPQ